MESLAFSEEKLRRRDGGTGVLGKEEKRESSGWKKQKKERKRERKEERKKQADWCHSLASLGPAYGPN